MKEKQNDTEGGIETKKKKKKNIIERATPKSLVVIDDLIEGTSIDAITKQTKRQYYALHHTGANVLLVTHRYDIAKEFKENTSRGNYIQVEFKDDIPTRQIIPGISSDSRADLVAQRVGMNEDSIESILRDRGYLSEGQSLYDV